MPASKMGRMTIEPLTVNKHTNHLISARGVYEPQYNFPVLILVNKFSMSRITLYESIVIIIGSKTPRRTVNLKFETDSIRINRRESVDPGDKINALAEMSACQYSILLLYQITLNTNGKAQGGEK